MSAPATATRPVPADLLPWAAAAWGRDAGVCTLAPVAGDASNRRYFRLAAGRASVIVLEAPPATEKNAAFISVLQLLAGQGVRVPALLAVELERGYLLLEDLGGQMLLPLLSADSVEAWYGRAGEVLLNLAQVAAEGRVPDYDRALLEEELSRLPMWFFDRLLALPASAQADDCVAEVKELLVATALAQPRGFVHRDFHSRNLMVLGGDELALIDFQDATFGPATYDLVSLLRDCYIRWPRQRVEAWALAHRDALVGRQLLPPVDDATFLRWFDLMGLQRHLKVLGTFARLYLRDGKQAYLQDLPLVVTYVEEVLQSRRESEPVLARFHDWWLRVVRPVIDSQAWMQPGREPS
ncbi:aminoglycoside phosphotransferase family protein [Parahaliea aestuarii]|uniref:aminoglycoside phosphotransferase family protein n=1 Tax=Parahaliea aestuarii TaxID=1852021 RepID=UPI001C9D51C7|nr:phosphotransferase [Parahaliea aestuarii]